MVGGGHQSCHWGVVVDTCTRGLKRGASNSAETIPTNQPTMVRPILEYGSSIWDPPS